MTEQDLLKKGLAALEKSLGRVEALRFLAIMSREPMDYQAWRDEHFAGMSLEEILERSRAMQ